MNKNSSNLALPAPASSGPISSGQLHLVDALPYIDTGYDEAARQAAMQMIEEECKRYRPTKNYLAHLPPLNTDAFLSPTLQAEWDRMSQRQPMEPISMKRYDVPGPPPSKQTDLTAWQDATNNAKAQLEHLNIRQVNLELMAEFSPEAYKAYNKELERILQKDEKSLVNMKAHLLEVHAERKKHQTDAGAKLKVLEESWVSLISKNYQIEKVCAEMDAQLEPLRKKYKSQTS